MPSHHVVQQSPSVARPGSAVGQTPEQDARPTTSPFATAMELRLHGNCVSGRPGGIMQNGSLGKAVADRYIVPLLIIGSLSLPLACGEPAGPVYATLAITTTCLPNAAPIIAYSTTLVATGGDSSYTWSVTDGSLPPGLSLTASTGVIAGIPVGAGVSSTFTVQVVSGDGQAASQQLTIYVYEVLTVTTTSLPSGATGVAYREALVAAGGDGDYTWSVAIGSLPTGLVLADSTGVISGTPSAETSETFTVQVASSDGQTALQQLAIDVALALRPSERCRDYPDYAIATFEDAALETAIRDALMVGQQEPLTCGVISPLWWLVANNRGITSLAGIQNLTMLMHLGLEINAISDISALSGLTSLQGLYLSANSIRDIGPLGGITSLTELYLGSNSISDISALSGLTRLVHLDLGWNSISDIGALSGLTSLQYLFLRSNSISDISAVSGLTSLNALILSDNSISDISALSGLTSLNDLILSNNSISDIGALSGFTDLTNLHLSFNSIVDISALSGFTSVYALALDNNSISDISALSGMSLKWLMLNNNPNLTDVQALLDNTEIGTGDTVYLESTNVSCTDVAALRAKGVTVYADCT